MIQNSFIFLDKIGKKGEKNLFERGINNWDSFLNSKRIKGLSNARKRYYDRQILNAKNALYNFDSEYFLNVLPQSEYWRLYDFFKDDAIFLDIETTGLSFKNDITVFGLYDGVETKTMIKNINLDFNVLKKFLCRYKLIVTYNGASFDIPFINKRYPGVLPKIPNFDIRFIANRLGLKGGLKEIERRLGINRKKIIGNFNGGDALTLWKMYKATGDDYYLKLLVEYNEEDIINLKTIADYCVERLKKEMLDIS